MSEISLSTAVEYLHNHIDAAPLERFHFATHSVLSLHLALQSPVPLPQIDWQWCHPSVPAHSQNIHYPLDHVLLEHNIVPTLAHLGPNRSPSDRKRREDLIEPMADVDIAVAGQLVGVEQTVAVGNLVHQVAMGRWIVVVGQAV